MLVSCAGSPAASPSPSQPVSTASATATPPASGTDPDDEATNEDATASEIQLSAKGFAILDAEGQSLFDYEWEEKGDLAIDALTEVFGADPVVTVIEGDGTHSPDYSVSTWDGVSFVDAVDLGQAREDYVLPAYMEYTAAQARGIALTTVAGVSVGDATSDVRALGPANSWYVDGLGGNYLFDVEDPDSAANGGAAGASLLAASDVGDVSIVTVRSTFDSNL